MPGEPYVVVEYDPDGDIIEVILKVASYYGDYVHRNLTLYRDRDTHEVVGLEIGGVSKLIQKAKQ